MKSAFKGLSIFVLIGISVFFSFVYYKTFIREKVFADDGNRIDGVQTEITQPPATDEDKSGNISTPIPPTPVFRTELPRNATKLIDGNINNVGGYGIEELKDYYKLSDKFVAILSTTSDNCDIRENGSGIALATFDNKGTLLSTYSLKADKKEKYLCSSLYDNGIMLVTTNQNNVIIHGYSLDGNINKLSLPINADNAICYYTNIGTMLACFSNGNIYTYCIGANFSVIYNFTFNAGGTTDPVALFKSSNFVLFANGNNNGKLFSFDLNGNSSSINLAPILDVIPTAEGYLVATSSGGKIFLHRYSYSLSSLGTSELATAQNVKLASSELGYFAITYGTDCSTTSYFLCKHFDVVGSNKSDYLGFNQVGEIITHNESIYFVGSLRGTSYIYEYNVNNHTAKAIVTLENSETLKFSLYSGYSTIFNESSTITMLFTSTNTIGDYKNNFGSSDVWFRQMQLTISY